MKKIKTFLLWILSVFLILWGLICFTESFISGLLGILSGLLCNPIVLKKITFNTNLLIPVVLILCIGSIMLFPTKTSENNQMSSDTPTEQKTANEKTSLTKTDTSVAKSDVTKETTTEKAADTEIKPNTSEMVDSIARKAKRSANKSASAKKRNAAISYIVDHYPDFYENNEVMEKTMYYGYYLEYAYSKNGSNNIYANLGMDVYQSIIYVYRNTENINDVHVKENLGQIKKALVQLGYNVN